MKARPTFDGATFSQKRDGARLQRQLADVLKIMLDGQPHTLAEIARKTGHPESSVSARIRDLRKPKFGGYTVRREHVVNGLWSYRIAKPWQTPNNPLTA